MLFVELKLRRITGICSRIGCKLVATGAINEMKEVNEQRKEHERCEEIEMRRARETAENDRINKNEA